MVPSLVRVHIKQIKVKFNGDDNPNKTRDPILTEDESAQDNLVIATLQYPRPGAPVVTSTKALDLPNNFLYEFDLNNFWESGLFKETVYGETVLQITLGDRDSRSAFLRVLGFLVAGGLGGFLGATVKGITNVVLGSVASNVSDTVISAIKDVGGKGNTKIIGKTEKVLIKVSGNEVDVTPENVWNRSTGEITLPLKTPDDLHYIDLREDGRKQQTVVSKGDPNGEVVITLMVEQMAGQVA